MADSPIDVCFPALAEPAALPRPVSIEREVLALFDLYRGQIFRYALSLGLTAHDGEDVVQEVFFSLFRHLAAGRSQESIRGWLFRVAHNLALKRRMSNLRHGNTFESNDGEMAACLDPNPDQEQQAAFRQRQVRLRAVVQALPEQDAYCLRLRAEGLKYREIANVLGMSLGAISLSLTRSLARLRRADVE
jgi:RNA polymerase sigma-70 factor (ECF subfamily)